KQALAARVTVPAALEPPAWLGGEGPAPAREYLPFPNGLLHLPGYLDGASDFWLQPTPRLFATRCLPFAFDPEASEPAAWLAFLGSVWPEDDQAIATLQEWFGYVVAGDTAQQKILMIVGPTRSGKGTIGHVARGLVGAEGGVGLSFANMGTNF